MKFKYQGLIDRLELTVMCPPENTVVNEETNAARFTIDPIDHELNFLPNFIYNSKLGIPPRVMSSELKCRYCSLSFYTSVEASQAAYRSLNTVIKAKLGYTHIAYGIIKRNSGRATPVNPSSQHFELFEAEGSEWSSNFKIVASL